jgi:hypothetical protein
MSADLWRTTTHPGQLPPDGALGEIITDEHELATVEPRPSPTEQKSLRIVLAIAAVMLVVVIIATIIVLV